MTTKTEIQANQATILLIRLFRRIKQIQKKLVDRETSLKGQILALNDGEFIITENGKKILSVSEQVRSALDIDKIKVDYPEFNPENYKKTGEPFKVIRLH